MSNVPPSLRPKKGKGVKKEKLKPDAKKIHSHHLNNLYNCQILEDLFEPERVVQVLSFREGSENIL